jgi:uncharacterized protein
MYVTRTIENFFIKASSQFPVILLTGARQVGKTTFLRHISEGERTYITLDDPIILNLARKDPSLFMQRFPPPVFIDEIQYAPELLPFIKMDVDQNRQPGRFWLTGSQQFHMMKDVSESLAGRVGIVQLLGLSRREITGEGLTSTPFIPKSDVLKKRGKSGETLNLKQLYKIIWRGSLPAIALNKNVDRDLFYSSYTQTYLQRDIRALAQVGDEMALIRFLRATAARSGQLLNMTDLSRDADIAPNTARKWISMLQSTGIIYLLQPYHTNVTKRLVKTPKLYFLDTGLCSWLTQWSSPETLEAGAMSGAVFETWVITEIIKSWWHNGREAPFYFYRDKDQKEIDLLVISDGTVYPLEIKKSASPDAGAVKRFQILEKLKMPVGYGGVICLTSQLLPLTSTSSAIPAGII